MYLCSLFISSLTLLAGITGGQDYESFSEVLVFNETTSQVCFEVTTLLDGIYEEPEVFTVVLTSQDSAVNNISFSESLVTILDFDEGTY